MKFGTKLLNFSISVLGSKPKCYSFAYKLSSAIYPLSLFYFSWGYNSFLQCIASISESPINHASQLSNPFLGLPLEFGKCESCGATETDKCEGRPVPSLPYFCSYIFCWNSLSDIDLCFYIFRSFWVYSAASANIPSCPC